MKNENRKKEIKLLFSICLTVIFMVGVHCIDLGASMKFLELVGIEGHAESLFFSNIEPRILYHTGIILIIACFLVSLSCGLFGF